MPLHIFLSTWVGSSFGVLGALKVTKDIIMVAGFIITTSLCIRKQWFKTILADRLLWLIVGYGTYTFILALLKSTDKDAEVLGLVYNTRFLVFFIYGLLIYRLTKTERAVVKQALMAVFATAILVLVFGLLQYLLMPSLYLERFGYSQANGVLPAFFIDNKPDLERIMSTLRDPNSYGSYLIVITSLAIVALTRNKRLRLVLSGVLGLAIINLILTFSRSAWIGFLASLFTLFIFEAKRRLKKPQVKQLAMVLVLLCFVVISFFVAQKNSYFVQNVVFHADNSTTLEDPNELRLRYWRESIAKIIQNPAGSGTGTAGLASIKNKKQGTVLNENYYLQIAFEVGIIGIALFISILAVLGYKLAQQSYHDWFSLALFSAFLGLAVTNFFVHIWSNEAVAYIWWGLAGIALPNRYN